MGPQNYPQQQLPNQYDFLNQSPQRKSTFLGGGGPKNKTLVSVIFVAVVLLVVGIAISVFNSLGKKDYTPYLTLAKTQTELIRITDLGQKNAKQAETRQYAATIFSNITTEKTATVTTLGKFIKLEEKILIAAEDEDNDKALESAQQSNRYDEKLTEIINGLLVAYQKQIKQASPLATTKQEKSLFETLQKNFDVIAKTTAN